MSKKKAEDLDSQQGQQKKQKSMLGSAFSFFDRLPNEVVCEIFSFLNKVELAKLAPTCVRFNHLVNSESVWQKASGIKDYTKKNFSLTNFRISDDHDISAICKLNNETMAVGYTNGLIKVIKFNFKKARQINQIQCFPGDGCLHTLKSDNRGNIIALRGNIIDSYTSIYIFHGETGKLIYQHQTFGRLQVLSDGTIFKCLAGGGCDVIHSYNPCFENLKINTVRSVKSMTVDNKGNLVLGLSDGRILLWNKNFKENIVIREETSSSVQDLQILPNGNILSIHENKMAYEWDLVTGKVEKRYYDLFLKTNIILLDGNIISYADKEWRIIDSKAQKILSNSFNFPKNYICGYWLTTFGDNDIVLTDSTTFHLVRYGYKPSEVKRVINNCQEERITTLQNN